jgi:hypothetical protein
MPCRGFTILDRILLLLLPPLRSEFWLGFLKAVCVSTTWEMDYGL